MNLPIVFAVVSAVVAIFLSKALWVVPEYQRLVVFRLGRVRVARGPGLIFLIPVVDRGVRVDLRERFFDVQPQTCITADNAPVSIDFLVYMKIVDALPSVLNVIAFEGAARGIALTTLRAVVGGMLLDDVLSKREEINQALRGKLDEVTSRWGIKVTAVEIREILPPRDIQDAMTRQMSAERSRRAMVTEADGKREAAIRVAEGRKQAAILRAEGQALALEKVFAVARTVDSKTMSLQYLAALKAVGAGAATKIVVPFELTNLLRPFVEHTSRANDSGPESQARVSRAA
jgi:regulator of protease activity HflC (stomatin/prohibitin superfamily)